MRDDHALEFLRNRRSVPAAQLAPPGPTPEQLREIIATAIRVPDHGKLTPWRLIAFTGDAGARYGEALAALHVQVDPGVPGKKLAKDRERFAHSPVVLAVIARIDERHPKIPAQEQLLSAGCLGFNLLLAAQAAGFAAQWLTGWSCYDPAAAKLLGLAAGERAIAYIHVGSRESEPPERNRPDVDEVVSAWTD
ncbi:MAG TPA: nitroreductase family protein [Rhodanobacteraceae bacterium]|jgi:nitroreductase|nr:nitroreductase family protein [Rhodanobacteraceae bacterium]